MDRFQEHWRFSSASSTGAAEMYRRSSSTYRNRAHWLAGAGQRRRSPPWPLFPVSPTRTLEYLEPSSVRHRERAPTGPAPLPLTSTRGAKSKQFLARRRRRRRAVGACLVSRHAASLPWVPRLPHAAGVIGIDGRRR